MVWSAAADNRWEEREKVPSDYTGVSTAGASRTHTHTLFHTHSIIFPSFTVHNFYFNIHAIFVRPHEEVWRTQVKLLCSFRCSRNVFTSCPSYNSDCCPVVIQGGFGFYAF